MVEDAITLNDLSDDRKNLVGASGSSTKIQIVPAQPKTLTHLPKRPPVELAFKDLTYRVKEGRSNNVKTILKEVSGRLRPGELCGIMGPSGAGKSTLLNILSGYKTSKIEGSITMNGKERNISVFRKLSAYIMQDNQLHANLTVVGAAMNVQNGVFLAPVMSVPFLLFSGFFVSFDAIPIYLRWITYLSYIRYGFEATALATYGYGREKLKCFQIYCHFKDPNTTLDELDMVHSDVVLDIVALIAIFFILRIAAYLFLRWKLKTQR